ncbi:hypothetical protein OG563_47160 [Nocardia vinacea]|uniref:Uncharacterized protein n=1 Tax=Nocardia vinacea TaxID=96468 RepID=A0ABZ1YU26_9NOCA|nr:hypothetical protein [Nocardia vinacea]
MAYNNARTTQSARPSSLYFVNPIVDFLCLGGISVILYLLFRLVPEVSTSPTVATVTLIAVWVVNYPHFASTNQRLYSSRAHLRQYPVTAWGIPILMIAAVVASFYSPTVIAPQLVLLYFLWSPFHYSGQTIGITLVYAWRAGIGVTELERKALVGVSLLTFALGITNGTSNTRSYSYFGVTYTYPAIPSWAPMVLNIALAGCALALLGSLGRRILAEKERVPLIILVPVVAQFIWFLGVNAGNFILLVPLFHSLQYLLIAWAVQLKERLDSTRQEPSRGFVLSETLRWVLINVGLGVCLFWALPNVASWFGKPLAFTTAILFVAIQIHHFFVDGVIWKLSRPNTTSPLSSSFSDLTGNNRPTETTASPATL